jgi:uncharacterized membrane-anchored protein YhcB (DUF1043 family)
MLEQTLTTVNSIIGIVGLAGLGGIGIAIYRAGAATVKRETNTQRDIADLKKQMDELSQTVQKDGLVKEIKTMQINCAGQMAALTTAFNEHAKRKT